MTMNLPILVTYALYFAIILGIGFIANRSNKNLSDYVLGGRHLSGPIAALGAGASDMSGWLLLGLPGGVYVSGLPEMWMPISLVIGAYLNWLFVAQRLRVYTEIANDSLTIPAYFDNRFHDQSGILRTITAIVVIVFFTFYASSGFVGGAQLFQSTFHLSYTQSLWISASFLVIYTAVGGFLAVSWVDFLQGSLMLFALLIVPIVTFMHVGGMEPSMQTLQQLHINYSNLFSGASMIGIISLLGWGLGYFGQPHILVRFMAAKDLSVLPLARRICMNWMILSLAGAIFTGLIGIVYFAQHPLEKPETVFIRLAESLFHPWIVGTLLAAVLSAIMSTIAAQLLASSSALTEDIYHRFLRRKASQKELVWISRITVLLVALIGILLAYNPESTILKQVAYAWGGLGASFGPVILFSLFWRRTTRNGAVAGMIFGSLATIIWDLLESSHPIFELYEIIPGFIIASAAIVIVSLCDKPPSAKIQQEYDEMERRINAEN